METFLFLFEMLGTIAFAASGAVLATASRGEYVDVSGFENGWFRVQYSGKTGYMSGDHLTLAAARPAAPAPAPAAPTTPAVPASGTGAEIAALARSFVGKAPYVYGGAGPSGFDCSGFTMYIYGQFGVRLPHGATDQMRYGAAVDRSQLQPGDLIFFHDDYYSSSTASHCGIYVGNDQFVLWQRRRPADGAERQSLLLRPLYRRPAHGLKRCILKTVPASAGTVFCSAFTCRRHGGGNRPEASAADDGLPEEKALEKAAWEVALISHFYLQYGKKLCQKWHSFLPLFLEGAVRSAP